MSTGEKAYGAEAPGLHLKAHVAGSDGDAPPGHHVFGSCGGHFLRQKNIRDKGAGREIARDQQQGCVGQTADAGCNGAGSSACFFSGFRPAQEDAPRDAAFPADTGDLCQPRGEGVRQPRLNVQRRVSGAGRQPGGGEAVFPVRIPGQRQSSPESLVSVSS